jgi:hypothetical protein
MKHVHGRNLVRNGLIISLCIFAITACDRSSSPEGRMSLQIESFQKEMIGSLQQQNKAILDSLGKIREELNEIKRQMK